LYSLLRPASEAVVLVAYLLDSAIDETMRLARAFNLELGDLIEQDRFMPNNAQLQLEIGGLEERARSSAIAVLDRTSKVGIRKVTGFGENLPDRIALFSRYLGVGEMIYRYLSAHVHVTNWVRISKEKAVPIPDSDLFSIPMQLNIEVLANTTLIILRLHEQNLIRLLQHAGYSSDIWALARSTSAAASRKRLDAMKRGHAPAD
jgi:hypothetical protein